MMPPPKVLSRTCDNCRKRKIKCVEEEGDDGHSPCVGCRNLQIDCTFDYVRKKPGRKNSFAIALKAAQAQQQYHGLSPTLNGHQYSPVNGGTNGGPSRVGYHPYLLDTTLVPSPSFTSPPLGLQTPQNSARSLDSDLPSSATDSLRPGPSPNAHPTSNSNTARSPFSFFSLTPGGNGFANGSGDTKPGNADANGGGSGTGSAGGSGTGNGTGGTGLSWLDSMIDTTALFGTSDLGFGFDPTVSFPSEQAQLLSLESPETLIASTSTGPGTLAGLLQQQMQKEPQLEDVTSWANISHYISLYLQYLWPLLPLVHRPTFAENLATRLDQRDTDFRALLLSIVAYTVSQLPTSRLVTDQFDVEGLKRLQRRCHRTSQALQRTYHGQVSLTQISIIIFDNFYLLSIGLAHTAASRLGQAVQLAFTLGLHSDSRTVSLGLDAVEVQLRRRVFWQLYASDKTRAVAGNPMLINDFQGVCSYPEAIDDDFITSQGMFPQPASRTSLLAGFVSVSKLFRILSECFFHHRCILSELQTIGTEWTVAAEERVHQLLREMPGVIQDPNTCQGPESTRQVFAMQRANILITVAIVKFALYDLRSALNVDEDQLGREREAIAREIHNLLMSIPVEDLASNGESVRGKVFHIACALCGQASTPGTDTELVKDWCNMFSAISFVQMPPPAPGAALDSRANSPPGNPVDPAST